MRLNRPRARDPTIRPRPTVTPMRGYRSEEIAVQDKVDHASNQKLKEID